MLVGDLGEQIAARYYGVELAPTFTPGYDLVDNDGRRIQVKTLRGPPTRPRTLIGEVRGPCDVVLVIRLHFDYSPIEAIEMPLDVAQAYIGRNGKVSWTRALVADDRVRYISGEALLSGPTAG
ncbi:MAG: hypothetical protein QOI73_367 [Solirubrobacteraceae bacterium]|nr:hypothetical protein [Solirubrobacteraceae bacterium]